MATENDLADASISLNFTGADSGQSSSGSGASSPQYKETSCDTPLPGAPSKQVGLDLAVDDLDMWDMLTALDGAPPRPLRRIISGCRPPHGGFGEVPHRGCLVASGANRWRLIASLQMAVLPIPVRTAPWCAGV